MNDLGYLPPKRDKEESNGAVPVTIVSDGDTERKPSYPTLCLNGEQAEKAGLTKCAHGEEYELTVRIKATRIGGWSYMGTEGKSEAPAMEFDVIAADSPKEVESSEEDATETDTEEKSEQKPELRKPKQTVKSPKDFDLA